MRLLFVTSHLELGGIPVYTVGLARALARRGHEPVVVSSGGVLAQTLAQAGIPHVRLDLRCKLEFHPKVASAAARLCGVIRRVRPDVLHAQTRVAQVAASVAGRLMRVPVITTAHGFYRWRWGRRIFPFWGRRVIAVSPMTRRTLTLAYRVPREKVALILNGIDWAPTPPDRLDADAAWFRQAWGIRRDGPVIGTMARLSPAKGHLVLLEAFRQLRQRLPAAQLLIVGDGPEKPALIRQAYATGQQDAVVITGFVKDTAVPLSLMDVFVLPSFREAFGLALVEAMAMAKPVIASSVGGMRAIVQDGRTGWLVPPRHPEALADAMQRTLADPAAARAMGEAGRRRYEDYFTMDRVAAEVERVYEDVLQEARQ